MKSKMIEKFVNGLFALTVLVWVIFDFLKLLFSPISPATHLIPESIGLFCVGILFGSKKQIDLIWPLVLVILVSASIYGLIDGHLFSILGVNLLLVVSFVVGYFLQDGKKLGVVE